MKNSKLICDECGQEVDIEKYRRNIIRKLRKGGFIDLAKCFNTVQKLNQYAKK